MSSVFNVRNLYVRYKQKFPSRQEHDVQPDKLLSSMQSNPTYNAELSRKEVLAVSQQK